MMHPIGVRRSVDWLVALLDEDLGTTGDVPPDPRSERAAHFGGLPHVLPRAVRVEGCEDRLAGNADPILTSTGTAVAVGLAVGRPSGSAATGQCLSGRCGRKAEPHGESTRSQCAAEHPLHLTHCLSLDSADARSVSQQRLLRSYDRSIYIVP